MNPRRPWTMAELRAMIPKIETELVLSEVNIPGIRPLPPMLRTEALELFNDLFSIATTRPMTQLELATAGQLLSVFEQAIRAEMLGKKVRCFVLTEDMINESVDRLHATTK